MKEKEIKKFKRRRAIVCRMIRKSKSNPEYFRYEIVVGETDGTITKHPAYGLDMQDAVSRLLRKERTDKFEKKMERNPFIFFLIWMAVMSVPVIFGDMHDTPWFILYLFGAFTAMFALAGWWQSYLEKGKDD
tara:strand:- start:2655 stop:3050 length:396 start_codon:yes stop_codon:yes gene_type:complete